MKVFSKTIQIAVMTNKVIEDMRVLVDSGDDDAYYRYDPDAWAPLPTGRRK